MSAAAGSLKSRRSLLYDWLDEEDAAPEIELKPSTLRAYRKRGVGPAYSLVGRKIKYHRKNLRAWLKAGGKGRP